MVMMETGGAPTRVRYRVVGMAVAMAAITYLDRVCISTLAPSIMRDLELSRVQMSFVFSAFTLAYGLFEVPTAWWGERVGTRRVLARIVVWWSVFTLATAAAFNYASMLAVRFLFGVGEAGAWPNAAKAFSRWIPAHERGRVQGVFFAGAHFAGGITPGLVALMQPMLGWRGVFLAFGALGFVWAAVWFHWYRDTPAEHPAINDAEVELIERGRLPEAPHASGGAFWKVLLSDRNVLALCAAYFANGYGFYFLITWLPSYLEQERGFTRGALSLFAGLPLLLAVLADLFGGVVTDRLTLRYGLRVGRTAVGAVAYFLAALCMLAAAGTADPAGAAILIALATAAIMFTLGASWAACIDIGGPNAGVVSATMNTAGQVGGILSPILLAYIVERSGNWAAPLHMMSALYAMAAIAWLFVDSRRTLHQRSAVLRPVSGMDAP